MALTVSTVDYRSEDVWGCAKVRFVDVTFDSSYEANGETLTPASCALAEIIGASVIGRPEGIDASYDPATGKLQLHVADVEVAGASDQDAVTIRLLVIGR